MIWCPAAVIGSGVFNLGSMEKEKITVRKASDLTKRSISKDEVYAEISELYNRKQSHYKHFIPCYIYLSEEVILQMLNDGFKVYKGDFDHINKDVWIIEW